jgi:NADH-quinone oxidoreductase subunit L
MSPVLRQASPESRVFDVIWLIPGLPLAGFLVLVVFGRRLGEPGAGYLATAMLGGSFLVSVAAFFDLLGAPADERTHVVTIFEWLPVGALQVDMAFLADPLSITMCLFVTGIGTLIHLYAVGYMHGDPKFAKFFVYLNLFAFSMLMLVLGENLLVTFLGWEGVVLAHLVLAPPRVGSHGRQEGLHHQPGR